jgi:hypothetical protein
MDSPARLIQIIVVILVTAACTCCGGTGEQSSGSNAHFWFTHCEGTEFRDVTKEPGYGESKAAVIVRINNNLILAPPPSVFPQYMGDDAKGPECRRIDDLPQVTNASFRFRASTLRGPLPTTDPKADPDVVMVYVMPKIQAPAAFPFTMEKDEQDSFEDSKRRGYQVEKADKYGLRCYGFPRVSMTCFGSTSDAASPDIVISVAVGATLGLRAQYLSPKYGGIGIIWITGTENLSRWKAIANRIYTDIDEWNALRQDSLTAAPQAVVHQ